METLQTPEEIKAFIVSTIDTMLSQQARFPGLDKELLERMVRVEEELKHIHVRFDENRQYQEKRFEAIDKRFDDLKEYNSKQFEAMERRFEENLAFQNQRFEAIDKRFEENLTFQNQRFEAIDRRFENMDKNMKWLIGSAFVLISLLMTFYKFLA